VSIANQSLAKPSVHPLDRVPDCAPWIAWRQHESGIHQVRHGRIGSTDVRFHSAPLLPICFQCAEFVEAWKLTRSAPGIWRAQGANRVVGIGVDGDTDSEGDTDRG